MAEDPATDQLEFDAALRAISAVLFDAQASNLAVQDHLGQFLDRKIDAASLIHELQTLDRTAQILADLAEICSHIAEEYPKDQTPRHLDLSRVASLDMTRRALLSACYDDAAMGKDEDLHLFG